MAVRRARQGTERKTGVTKQTDRDVGHTHKHIHTYLYIYILHKYIQKNGTYSLLFLVRLNAFAHEGEEGW